VVQLIAISADGLHLGLGFLLAFFSNRKVDESSCESAFWKVVTWGHKYFIVAGNIIVLRFFDNSGARDKTGACFPAIKKYFFSRKDRRVAPPSRRRLVARPQFSTGAITGL